MITIDLSFFSELSTHSPFYIMGVFFIYGGWIPVVIIFLWAAKVMWLKWRQRLYARTIEYTLLAIDIPKENEQSPMAVEHIFSQLTGTVSGIDFREKWWYGKFHLDFSLEIISDGGYVQFLIRTPTKFRDLVEAAFFAQYPDAEIVEVEEYADKIPRVYPSETYDLFGTEFILAKPAAYPLRTYPQFEHQMSRPGTQFKSPIAGLLEVMSRIGKGEQLWLQIIIVPADSKWKDDGEAIVAKIIGKKAVLKQTWLGKIIEFPVILGGEIVGQVLGGEAAPPVKEIEPKLAQLTPGDRLTLEAVQMKLSKSGFLTKFRFVYAALKPVFDKGRAALIKASLQQYGSLSMNSFKGYGLVTPQTDYFWQRWSTDTKKMRLAHRYLNRSFEGAPPYILNIEELATIYHFPILTIKAPLLKRTEAKRAEPPFRLPVHDQPPTTNHQPPTAEGRELEATADAGPRPKAVAGSWGREVPKGEPGLPPGLPEI